MKKSDGMAKDWMLIIIAVLLIFWMCGLHSVTIGEIRKVNGKVERIDMATTHIRQNMIMRADVLPEEK